MAAKAKERKPEPCKASVHGWAPHGTKGPCPTCGRRRCHGKAKGEPGRCRLFPVTAAMVCRSHGAAKGTKGREAAEARQQEERGRRAASKLLGLGAEPAVDYREALVNELATWSVVVKWYRDEISKLDALSSTSDRGESAHVLVQLHDKAAEHLLRVIKACHEARIDQQMLDLARAHADQTDRLIHALLRQLGHDPQDPTVRGAVRGALELVEGGAAS